MSLHPVKEGQLILCHTAEQVWIWIAILAQLFGHILYNLRYTRVILVIAISYQQIKLGIFFNFYTQVVQRLYWCIAGKKVLRSWAKGDNF